MSDSIQYVFKSPLGFRQRNKPFVDMDFRGTILKKTSKIVRHTYTPYSIDTERPLSFP